VADQDGQLGGQGRDAPAVAWIQSRLSRSTAERTDKVGKESESNRGGGSSDGKKLRERY